MNKYIKYDIFLYVNKNGYDINIINALKKLPLEMLNYNGHYVVVRDKARSNESGFEHIAKKSHGLQVRDIESIPSILLHPIYVCIDPNNKVHNNYYGTRKGKNNKGLLIKIVTKKVKNNIKCEQVVTIYITKSIKVDKN